MTLVDPHQNLDQQNALTWAVVEGEIGTSFTPNSVVPVLKGKR